MAGPVSAMEGVHTQADELLFKDRAKNLDDVAGEVATVMGDEHFWHCYLALLPDAVASERQRTSPTCASPSAGSPQVRPCFDLRECRRCGVSPWSTDNSGTTIFHRHTLVCRQTYA